MKKNIVSVWILEVVAGALFGFLAHTPWAWSEVELPAGRLIFMEGKVQIISLDPESKATPATLGVFLKAGEVVKTEANSKAKIALTDNAIVDLGEDSEMRVSPPRKTQEKGEQKIESDEVSASLNLVAGRIRVLVGSRKGAKPFMIRTRSAVMGVRGTDVAMSEVEMLCVSGKCDVSSDRITKPVSLGTGEKVLTATAGPFSVQKIELGEVDKKYQAILNKPIKSDHDKALAGGKGEKAKEGSGDTGFGKKLKEFDAKPAVPEGKPEVPSGISKEDLGEFLEKEAGSVEVKEILEKFGGEANLFAPSIPQSGGGVFEDKYVPPGDVIRENMGGRYVIAVDQIEIAPKE